MPRNPLGNIHRHSIVLRGKRQTVFDVTKRYTAADGSHRKLFKRCYSQAEASIQLTNFHLQAEQDAQAPTEYGFADLVAYFRSEYVKPAVIVRGRKVAGYRRNLANVEKILDDLGKFFGNAPLREITYEHLRKFAEEIASRPTARGTFPAVSTINEKLSTLRRLFNIGIQVGWMDINPFKRGRSLIDRAGEAKRNRMLSFEEEARLIEACRPHKIMRRQKDKEREQEIFVDRSYLIPLIVCALDTAMRAGEIFDLRWWQVDLENRVIFIKNEAAERTKTGFGGVIPMTDRLHDILSELYATRSDVNSGDTVFRKFDYKKAWKAACEEAEIEDFQFRDCRSTAATRMVLAGNRESQVMKITRHRNTKIFLENYSNVDIINARRIGQNLSEFIKNQGTSSNASSNEKEP